MECLHAAPRCAITLLLVLIAGACSTTNAVAPEADAAKGEPGVKCLDLSHGCHYVDFGEPGEIHDCHDLGHEGPESACVVEHDRCVNLCAAKRLELGIDDNGNPLDAGADGSSGGDAGSKDGGIKHDASSHQDAGHQDADASHPHDAGHSHDAGHDTGSPPRPPPDAGLSGAEQCVRLGNVCHKVDTGEPGPIHDCHEIGHDGTISTCVANYSRCIDLCTNAAP